MWSVVHAVNAHVSIVRQLRKKLQTNTRFYNAPYGVPFRVSHNTVQSTESTKKPVEGKNIVNIL